MDFDSSRVYTALNADALKVGSKVIVADNIDELKRYVEDYCDGMSSAIDSIMPEYFSNRFASCNKYFNLAYLIFEPEEKVLKWTDLELGDIIRQKHTGIEYIVTGLDKRESKEILHHVRICFTWIDDCCLAGSWEKVEK